MACPSDYLKQRDSQIISRSVLELCPQDRRRSTTQLALMEASHQRSYVPDGCGCRFSSNKAICQSRPALTHRDLELRNLKLWWFAGDFSRPSFTFRLAYTMLPAGGSHVGLTDMPPGVISAVLAAAGSHQTAAAVALATTCRYLRHTVLQSCGFAASITRFGRSQHVITLLRRLTGTRFYRSNVPITFPLYVCMNCGGICRRCTTSASAVLTCSRRRVNAVAAASDSWPAGFVCCSSAHPHCRSRPRRHGSCTARCATACGSAHGTSSRTSCCRADRCCSPAGCSTPPSNHVLQLPSN